MAEVDSHDQIRLVDPEHDRFVWLTPQGALQRVAPHVVRESLACALRCVGVV